MENGIIEFLQMEKVEVKEKIKEYLDKDFKTNKLNERLDYLEILINKAANQKLEELRKENDIEW